MSAQSILFLLIVFAVATGIALLAMVIFVSGPLRQRMVSLITPVAADPLAGSGWVERVAKVAQPFSRLSLPDEGWERSPMRTRFMNAGWRSAAAPTFYFGAKTALALSLPALGAVLMALTASGQGRNGFLFVLLVCASIGYYLPNLVLARVVARRQREIFESFPDALDLLTVCVEAGLSLERALVKVANEIHIKSVVLAQELQLVLMEMRAGFSKDRALRNLALRTGVEDVDTLVVMLIQSERFGTSMGDALRVHSDNLRSKRNLIAEEAAAKISLKLLFPLTFCVFPTLLMVLLGPAAIQMVKVVLPTLMRSQGQ
jgi:tight adherence protein C